MADNSLMSEFEAVAAQAASSQPVRFDVDKRQDAFVQRVALAAVFAALAEAVAPDKRDTVILCAKAAGLVVR